LKQEGIVLYDSNRHRLAAAKKMRPEDRLDYAKTNFDEWFGSAERFYGTFEYDLSKGWTKEAAFLLHQTVERLYHTVLLVLTAYKPKTHNLEDLGKRASDWSPELRGVFPRDTPDEDRFFKLPKSAYIDARYKLTYSITTEELTTIASWFMICAHGSSAFAKNASRHFRPPRGSESPA
jgi:HEPN domain-containing protein